MKKVLHISKYYFPFAGGIEEIAKDCVESLEGKYEQKVICFNHEIKGGDRVDKVSNVEVVRCNCEKIISSQPISLSYPKILKETIDTFKPDIVLLHYPNPYVSHFLLKLIDNKCKLVLYWHLDIVKQKIIGKFFKKQNEKLLKKADIVIATSPNYIDGSKWLSKYKKKCHVVPCCINETNLQLSDEILQKSRKIRQENSSNIICLAVGRHTEYKGTRYLLEASDYLPDNYKIKIAGTGELTDSLKEYAKEKNLKNVAFLGRVDQNNLLANLYACDIFCFPSITKNEAFGIALAEGMYFKKPAVTFTIPGSGVNYVSQNGQTGIEVPNRDSKAFANAIMKLGENEELRVKLGNNGYKRVMDNFTYSDFKVKLLDIFNEL